MQGLIEIQTSERLILNTRACGIPEVRMLGRYNYAHAHSGLIQHMHPGAMEICVLAKGTQLYRVGRKDYVLHGGDVFITFPGEAHSTGEAPQEKGVLYWLILHLPKRPTRFLNCQPDESRKLVAELRAIPRRHFMGMPGIHLLLDEIMSAAQADPNPLCGIFIRAKLAEFLLKILLCSKQPPKTCISTGISNLLRHIDDHIEEPLPIMHLAAEMNLSVSRFKTRFKKEIGVPPAEYVLRCKIARAKKLLTRPGATVTETAHRLNFSSSQYFATVFKRYTREKPGLFLKCSRGGLSSTRVSGCDRGKGSSRY